MRLYLAVILALFLSGCTMLQPASLSRQSSLTWQQQPLEISAEFNELLMHRLYLSINGAEVINASLGNPQFPEYSETARKQTVPFQPVEGRWQNHSVSARCDLGPWEALLRYPRCRILIDQHPVTEFNFNR